MVIKNWRTTGFGVLIMAVAVYNSWVTGEPVNMITLIGLLTGVGLFVARDQKG